MKKYMGVTFSIIFMVFIFSAGCSFAPRDVAQGTKSLSEDRWMYSSFELSRSAKVQVSLELISGPAIDVYMVDESGMNTWNTVVAKGQSSGGDGFVHYSKLGRKGLSLTFTSKWDRLSKGKYYLIIDNTDHGGTAPPMNGIDDIAVVSYVIRAK